MAIKRFCRKVRLLLIESGIFQQGGNVPGEFLRVVSCKATVVDLVWHAVSTAGSADYRQAVRNSFYDFYLDAGAAKYRTEIGRAHVELTSLMRISFAVFCLKKKNNMKTTR